jgi:hypothetical protein
MPNIITSIEEDLDYLLSLYTHIDIFSNNAKPTSEDTLGGKNSLGQIAITPVRTGQILTVEFTIPLTIFCPSTITDTGSTSSVLELISGTGFEVGDRIRVRLAGNYRDREITAKNVNQITLDSALPSAPAAGISVDVKITQAGLVKNGDPGPGTLAYVQEILNAYKPNTTVINGRLITKLIGN